MIVFSSIDFRFTHSHHRCRQLTGTGRLQSLLNRHGLLLWLTGLNLMTVALGIIGRSAKPTPDIKREVIASQMSPLGF